MTLTLPPARELLKDAPPRCYDLVVLNYEERLLRRKRLITVHDESFLVDLPSVTNLDDYWGFRLEDGRCIQVMAAEERLVEVTAPPDELVRLAWHVGNRHTPCQMEPGRLLIRQDRVIEAMLAQLGASLRPVVEPFSPEGGAYGHGRTMGHDHGHDHGLGGAVPPVQVPGHGHDHDHPDGQ